MRKTNSESDRKQYAVKTTAVKDLIVFLKSHFSSEDKLCYKDYVQGLKNDCEYVMLSQLGERFFRKLRSNETSIYVNEDDVMMI